MTEPRFFKIYPGGKANPDPNSAYLLRVHGGQFELTKMSGGPASLSEISSNDGELKFALEAAKEEAEVKKALRRYLRDSLDFLGWRTTRG